MNNRFLTCRIAVACLMAAFTALTAVGQPNGSIVFVPDCTGEVPLLAGQYHNVGKVIIENNDDYLCVTYELSESALAAGWLIYETHLAIALDLADIPQTQGNQWGTNPIPGQFPLKAEFPEGTDTWTECVSLDDLGWEEGDMIYIAAHASVMRLDIYGEWIQETAWGEGNRFNERGNWGMYLCYEPCTTTTFRYPLEGEAYIGYEDQEFVSDFDYNDFGMSAVFEEIYVDGVLREISLSFTARTNRAGHVHDIHIFRTLKGDYSYTVDRSEAAATVREVADNTVAVGSGDFDVVLFDTARWPNSPAQVMGQTVDIHIVMDAGNNQNLLTDIVAATRFDLDDIFSVYDPWMRNRTVGFDVDIAREKVAQAPLPTVGYNVPAIIVVPVTDWAHPGETVTVTTPYPYLDDYYMTQNALYAGWYMPGFTP